MVGKKINRDFIKGGRGVTILWSGFTKNLFFHNWWLPLVVLLHILPSIDKSQFLWQQNDKWLDTLLWKGRVTQVSKCHNTKMLRLHREFLASSPSTSRVSSVLVDSFFLQSGIKSSFLEFANNISLAVCLKLVALKVSPKMSLRWNSRSKIHQGANRTCPPCWWC